MQAKRSPQFGRFSLGRLDQLMRRGGRGPNNNSGFTGTFETAPGKQGPKGASRFRSPFRKKAARYRDT